MKLKSLTPRMKLFLSFIIPMIIFFLILLLFDNNIGSLAEIYKNPHRIVLLLRHTITFTIPIFLAALGGLYSERSGVINLALEGIMLTGAFFAVLIAYFTQDFILAIIFGIIMGIFLGFIHAFISIHLKGDQIISGVAINILALGMTNYFYKVILKEVSGAEIPGIPTINDIMGWNELFKNPPLNYDIIRMVGYILFEQSPLVYITIGLGILGYYILFHTSLGLRIRAVGEHPRAADTLGINVYLFRYGCVIISGALAGFAGVYLSMGFLSGTFAKDMSGGRGFIAIAAYIFGNWNVGGTAFASLLFGFFSALEEFLKGQEIYLLLPFLLPGIGWEKINILATEFLDMIPYLLTVIVLSSSVRKARSPGAIGTPYEKE